MRTNRLVNRLQIICENFWQTSNVEKWSLQEKFLTSQRMIDLNSRREFNYYRKTSILFIIEKLWAWLKVTSFALITGSSPFSTSSRF